MGMPTDFYSELDADGDIANENGKVIWNPPPDGGTLRWISSVNRQKSSTTFDAYMTRDWALFRGSDIIPPARTKSLRGAQSETELRFDLPMNWSSTTQYAQDDGSYVVKNPKRRFDRPTGWMMLGKTGSRTDRIADVRVIISGPQKQNIRRLDMLAFLRWNLAEITQVFPDFPERLTVFSAAEPMWRGGLSAPASVYIHQSRPLISENGTSTLLHEVVHVALGAKAANDADWIIEGMAEYYGLQAMLRSGTISKSRYDSAIASLAQWAKDAPVLCGRKSSGAITAKATVTMYDLDQELQKNSEGRYSLDDVARSLAAQDSAISVADLSDILGVYSDEPSRVLESANVVNCSD
jgi:hypothetical protein